MQNLLALLILATAAAPSPTAPRGLFELHAESSPASAAAKAWTMKVPGGETVTIYLDPAVLLDTSAVATADVEHGPDGSPLIRLGLTPDGAQRLAETASHHTGKRLGVIVAGILRAAPYVTGAPTGGVFVIAGCLTDADATDIARSLGPPARATAGAIAAAPRSGGAAIPELQGRWRVVEATMNGRPMQQPKIAASSWFFRGAELILTNGEGQSQTFALRAEEPGVLRLEPFVPSPEKGGWILWSRDKQDVIVAFQDNLDGRPDGLQPGPKKIVARLRAAGPR